MKKTEHDIIAEAVDKFQDSLLDKSQSQFITRNARPEHLSVRTLKDSIPHLKAMHDADAEFKHATPEVKAHSAKASQLLQAYMDHVAKMK